MKRELNLRRKTARGSSNKGLRLRKDKLFYIFLSFMFVMMNFFPILNGNVKANKTSDFNQVLNVSFNGAFEDELYEKAAEEVVFDNLKRRSKNESIHKNSGVKLSGDLDGIDFKPNFNLGNDKTVDKPVIVETIFKPEAEQESLGTILSVGGNIFVRYADDDSSKLEYGFNVNDNGSWLSFKDSIPAPETNKEHILGIVYIPTDEGAEMKVYLNDEELDSVKTEQGRAALDKKGYSIGFGNEVNEAGQNRGFKGIISKIITTQFSGDFHDDMFELININEIEESESEDDYDHDEENEDNAKDEDSEKDNEGNKDNEVTPTRSQDVLDVSFSGAFSSDAGYTNATGEIMDGKLMQKTGKEEIKSGAVPLAGNEEGINFKPRETLINDGKVEKAFIMEVEFNPEYEQGFQDTLLAFGGNMYARYTSPSVFEYGFDSNEEGSWKSNKQVIDAPEAGETHNFAIVYIPTSNGAEMYAFLNGEQLPSVSSNSQMAISEQIDSEFAFGNDVHPQALNRGFKGNISRAVITTFDGEFETRLLKTMEITNIDRLLRSYWQGTIENGKYVKSDDEILKGHLNINHGEITRVGTLTLEDSGASVKYSLSSEATNDVLEKGFISEMLIEPSLLKNDTSLIEVGKVKLKSAKDGKGVRLYIDSEEKGYFDYSNYTDDDYIHLSLVYINNGDEHSFKLLSGREQVGSTAEVDQNFSIEDKDITFVTLNHSSTENLLGAALSAFDGPFNPSHLMLTSGVCYVPEDLQPSHKIEIKPGECAEAIAAKASLVRPKPKQVTWQQYEQTAFIHYGINTYYGVEWGDLWNHDDPEMFNPTDLDTDQWARTLKESGFKMAVLTAKHHDGFALYPSRYTDFSVANSPWKNGNGDVLKEFTESMRKYGLKVGVYLSPADHAAYRDGIFANGSERKMRSIPTLVEEDDRKGKDLPTFELQATDYGEMFLNQLYEVLTEYGEIDEIWFDGAQGNIPGDKEEKYDWDSYYRLINELAPEAVIAVTGPDVRWVGNESGWARENEWSVLAAKTLTDGRQTYYPSFQSSDLGSRNVLAEATSNGMEYLTWWPAEVDVSIRPGWFYHENQEPKSLAHLRNIYYDSIARNSVLLLNVPPNKEGKFADQDVERLKEWHESILRDFAINHTTSAEVTAHNGAEKSTPYDVIDGDYNTSWFTDSTDESSLTFTFDHDITVERIILQENINHGQQVEKFAIDVKNEEGKWEKIYENEVIGYKRIVTLDNKIKGKEFRLRILQSRGPVHLSEVGFYESIPDDEPLPFDTSRLEALINIAKRITNDDKKYTDESFENLQNAIKIAEKRLNDIKTEDELEKEITALQAAIDSLEERKPDPDTSIDISELEKLLEKARNYNKEEYTAESYAQLLSAIELAESVLANPKSEEEVKSALLTLQSAIDSLEEKKVDSDQGIDLSELEALIETAKGYNKDKYTDESYAQLLSAIESAESVLANPQSEEEVKSALSTLQSAIDSLEKRKDVPKDNENVKNEENNIVDSTLDKKLNDKLPNTATNIYNIIIVGVIMLVIGGASILFIRRKIS